MPESRRESDLVRQYYVYLIALIPLERGCDDSVQRKSSIFCDEYATATFKDASPMSPGEVERKLSAIFSADVKGYSRLMSEDEEFTNHFILTLEKLEKGKG